MIIILFLLLGAIIGFKKGFIKTLVSLIGVFIVIIVSFYLKKPVANFMYQLIIQDKVERLKHHIKKSLYFRRMTFYESFLS